MFDFLEPSFLLLTLVHHSLLHCPLASFLFLHGLMPLIACVFRSLFGGWQDVATRQVGW